MAVKLLYSVILFYSDYNQGQGEAHEFVICLVSKFILWVRHERPPLLEVEKCVFAFACTKPFFL